MKSEIKKVISYINNAQTIGLMTHLNGDGDAFGSILALRNILESLGKKVVIFSNEPLPKYLHYREKQARYRPAAKYQKVDLLIGLDVSSRKRFTIPEVFDSARKNNAHTLVIDHHAEGNIFNEVDYAWRKNDISSTAEMIYWLLKELKIDFDKSTAEFLLWGLETDTYFLSNPNVFPSTQRAREDLWKHDANTEDIKENTKAVSITSNKKFMDLISAKIQGKDILYVSVTADEKSQFGVHEPVSSAIANFFDYHRKPKIIIVVEQRTPEILKVSMRSNHSDADVSKIAARYGGGGHVKAAGFEIEGKVEKVYDGLIKEILNLVDTDLK